MDTIMEIRSEFNTDLYWLLYGEELTMTQPNDFEEKVTEKETDLIIQFRKLKIDAQDEILDFIKLKIIRYNSLK